MTNYKNYKNKILALCFIAALIIGFGSWRIAEAADSSIYVSPSQSNKEIGETIDIAVKVNPNGQKVCAVEGKLILDKLSCQKITIESGVSPQISPSCDNLNFLLGVQGCTTSQKTLFTITVKAENEGTGTATFTGVDIIGEGVSISSVSSGGSYTITTPVSSCSCESWTPWENEDSICGSGTCSSKQRPQNRTRTCTPSACDIEKEERCIDDSTCIPTPPALQNQEYKEENEGVTTETSTEEQEELDQNQESEEIIEESNKDITAPAEFEEDTSENNLQGDVGMLWEKVTQPTVLLIVIVALCLIGLAVVGIKKWQGPRREGDE